MLAGSLFDRDKLFTRSITVMSTIPSAGPLRASSCDSRSPLCIRVFKWKRSEFYVKLHRIFKVMASKGEPFKSPTKMDQFLSL